MATLFSLDGWVDAKAQLAEESAKLKKWTYMHVPHQDESTLVSSTQIGCTKTDIGTRPVKSLKGMLAAKTIVPAKDLSAAEQVDAADVLLLYQSMVLRNHPMSTTLSMCAYVHDSSLLGAKDDAATLPFRAMTRSVCFAALLIMNCIAEAKVRDGDEEFQPQAPTIAEGSVFHDLREHKAVEMLDELDAAIAHKNCTAELKIRLTLQRAFIAIAWHFVSVHSQGEEEEKKEEEKKEEGAATAAAASATTPSEKANLQALLKALHTALGVWHRDAKSAEPAFNSKVFTEAALSWPVMVQANLAGKAIPVSSFVAAKECYKHVHRDLVTVLSWRTQKLAHKDMYTILRAVKAFAQTPPASAHGGVSATTDVTPADECIQTDPQAGLPCLLVRSLAATFLFDQQSGKVLGQKHVVDVLTHTLDVVHGAPIYDHIVQGHHEVLTAVASVKYDAQVSQVKMVLRASGQTMSDKELEAQMGSLSELQDQIKNRTKGWLMQVAAVGVSYINALLHTRSRCHRKLNSEIMPQVASLFNQPGFMNVEVDLLGVADMEKNMGNTQLQKHYVVMGFVHDMLLDMAEHVLTAEIQLGLAAPAELPGLMMYRYKLAEKRMEALDASMFLREEQLSLNTKGAGKANKVKMVAQHGAGPVYRQARAMPMPLRMSLTAAKQSANISFVALSALAPALPASLAINPSESTLMPVEIAFMRRVKDVRRHIVGGEAYLPDYNAVREQMRKAAADPIQSLTQAAHALNALLPVAKTQVEKDAGAITMRIVHAAEKLGRENLVVFNLAKTLIAQQPKLGGSETYVQKALSGYTLTMDYCIEFPMVLHFSLKQKKEE